MSRELDAALGELNTAAAPLVSRFVPRTRSSTRQWLRVMRACDSYARPLARAGFAAGVTGAVATPDPAVATVLRQAGEEVRGHIAQLQSMLHGAPARSALSTLRRVLDAQPPGPPNRHARLLRSTVFALVRIDRAVLEQLPSENAQLPARAALDLVDLGAHVGQVHAERDDAEDPDERHRLEY